MTLATEFVLDFLRQSSGIAEYRAMYDACPPLTKQHLMTTITNLQLESRVRQSVSVDPVTHKVSHTVSLIEGANNA